MYYKTNKQQINFKFIFLFTVILAAFRSLKAMLCIIVTVHVFGVLFPINLLIIHWPSVYKFRMFLENILISGCMKIEELKNLLRLITLI